MNINEQFEAKEKELEALRLERNKLLELVSDISQQCIGEIAMGYKLSPESIGNDIYEVTRLTSPELLERVKNNG